MKNLSVVIDGAKVPGYDVHNACEAVIVGPCEGGYEVRIAGSDYTVLTGEQLDAALVETELLRAFRKGDGCGGLDADGVRELVELGGGYESAALALAHGGSA